MIDSPEIKRESVAWKPVYVVNEETGNNKQLFIPHFPSRPDTWGKESFGGWDARLPENLPDGTIVFFIAPERKKIEVLEKEYPIYFAYRVRRNNNGFLAEQLSMKLEDYEDDVRLNYEKNYIYQVGPDSTIFYDVLNRERILKGDYDNRFSNLFQLLMPYSTKINILILTPDSQKKLKNKIAKKIK